MSLPLPVVIVLARPREIDAIVSLPSPPSIVCAPSEVLGDDLVVAERRRSAYWPGAAVRKVVAVAAVEAVVAVAPTRLSSPSPPDNLIVAAAAERTVVTGVAGQLVVAVAAGQERRRHCRR